MTRIIVFIGLVVLLGGCGSRRPEADVNRGRQAVVAALDSWKNKEPASKLKSLADPVEFSDELQKIYSLVDYTLGRVDASDPEVIRYAVVLKLKDKKGKVTEREAVYSVALKNPVAVARDPYY